MIRSLWSQIPLANTKYERYGIGSVRTKSDIKLRFIEEKKMKKVKKMIGFITVLALVLSLCACGGQKEQEVENSALLAGLVIQSDGNEITVAWDEIDRAPFEGDIANGKGEMTHRKNEGSELRTLLEANGIEISEDSVISAPGEDGYSAELTGTEILEKGKVYVALSDNGAMIESIQGGQGAQMIVFGDPNSKRGVKYLEIISVD